MTSFVTICRLVRLALGWGGGVSKNANPMDRGALNFLLIAFGLLADCLAGHAAESSDAEPLTRLSLSELRNVEVTSVSRKEESLLDAPAAVYVLTNEDIKRSGATTIPEALRMVPGLSVAQINANKWAVSARGFNGRFANKQLVMIDGRTVYTPVFSGVYWDAQDTFLEDIDRIEVIRGPGGTLWGANAVNGVINVHTRDAQDTQGLLITSGYGTEERGFGGLRYGGQLGENWFYRVYAKGFNRDDNPELSGAEGSDEWWQQREGFRLDWHPEEETQLTLQGDYYYGRSGDRVIVAAPAAPFARSQIEKAKATGANLLARWSKTLSESSDYIFQAYYDRAERENLIVDAEIDTFDADFQHRFHLVERSEFIYGLGYRLLVDDIEGTYSATYDPASRHDQLLSAFVQNEVSVVEDRFSITPGIKVEHNDYSGWEFQPGLRGVYKITPARTLWASVSRAVRTPARFEHDTIANIALPGVTATVSGNRTFESEELIAYEVGYRSQPAKSFQFDLALFYNVYDELRTSERGPVIVGAPVRVPITYGNNLDAETYGAEVAPTWQITPKWRLSAGYSFLDMELHLGPGSTDLGAENAERDSPEHQVHLRSFLDLPYHLQFDTALYHVDALANQRVPSYTRIDCRLGWSPRPDLDISLVFQNLLDPRHPEFGASTLVIPTQVERSLYGKITWRF